MGPRGGSTPPATPRPKRGGSERPAGERPEPTESSSTRIAPAPPEVAPAPESPAALRSRAANAVDQLLGAIRSGDAGTVERLSGGGLASVVAMMREGRLTVGDGSDTSAPSLRDDRMRVEFTAEIRWRSPFGANRRRVVPFVAELARGGEGWRMVSCRMTESVDFR
jgi:hypothetical protein